MKKLCVVTLLLILTSNYAFSQSGWFWQNPQPQGNVLRNVYFLSNEIAIACGGTGTILKSTNHGLSWHKVNSNTDKNIYTISFIDDNTGFAGGEVFLKTTDSGENWTVISTQKGNIYFINHNTGFAIGSIPWPPPTYNAGFIAKSTNGGLTWSQFVFSTIAIRFTSINFRNNTGAACGVSYEGASVVVRTTNFGDNWLNFPTNINGDLQSIKFLNDSSIIATGFTGTNGIAVKTTDLGANWSIVNNNLPLYIYGSLFFMNENTGYVTGPGGVILKTTNSGFNWNTYSTAFSSGLYGISFNNSGSGIVCGDNGIFYLSSNSGTNWHSPFTRIYEKNFTELNFLSKDSGYVLGDSSKIFRTTNGGNNWSPSQIDDIKVMRSIFFVNFNTGYSVGQAGGIFKTTNAGLNWFSQNFNYTQNLNDVYFVDENTGFITGFYTEIIKTTNSGLNWIQIPTGYSFSMISLRFLNKDTGFVVGTSNTILRTTNGGYNWNRVFYIDGFGHFSSLCFINSDTGFVVGGRGDIYKTVNGGLNWFQQVTGVTVNFNSVSFSDANRGYVVGDAGNIYSTSNGGNTWNLLNSITSTTLNSVAAIDSLNTIVVGNWGLILKTTTGGNPIIISPISSQIPQSFSLNQNYPNPFNPVTKIKFDIPAVGQRHAFDTRLIIYDLLGREVTTLVNEQLKPGSYEVEWDGSVYASGVYFYSLITEEYVETKRMVLIK